ncbi:MAG: phospho-sugar mutase [Hespellia sp.]|nr:phospho-sugar mutase [Hespellia sp.]
MDHKITEQYELWRKRATEDVDMVRELELMADNPEWMKDAFYRELAFGTGGLRGIIGAGTNRMNIYTVAKASQGLANYIINHYPEEERMIAVSYDSRIKSERFAQVASEVFAVNGIRVQIYPQLMPTPCLSFAVRRLHCAAGIMVTASHNPSKYNGYKVYGADGCQITTEAADEILSEIEKLDIFTDRQRMDFFTGLKAGLISRIDESVYTAYVESVKAQSMLNMSNEIPRDVAIVYSPLNGTGLAPVLRTLKESGYTNITVVKEQEQPDGKFPTCPYPNPEIKAAMKLGMEYAKKYQAELLIATDPDCDRVGIAVRNYAGEYTLLSGNETGILLLDYICSRRMETGTMPENPVMIKTIVTTDMAERIAKHYGVKTINVLTGFKFIGEQIGKMEANGCADSYIFGLEESYGYLSGSYVRDKDAVDGAFLICEMFAYYKSRQIGLMEKLAELYRVYGFCLNTQHSFLFEGAAGFAKMQEIMQLFRSEQNAFGGKRVLDCLDYRNGLNGLSKSDVLKFLLEDHCSVVVRPSGTEPKLKVYISVSAGQRLEAVQVEASIIAEIKAYL